MKSLYLDNFRGFHEASIALEDVNFCVGENSSGKTSLLSAINLLSSSRFWFEQSFEGSEVSISHFEDFVSVTSVDKTYFRMGVADTIERNPGSEQHKGRAFLFTYADHEGVPKLRSFTTNYRDSSITLYFSEVAVRYRILKLDSSTLTSRDKHHLLFKHWAALQDDRSLRGTKIVKDEGVTKGYVPPLYALITAVREGFSTIAKDGKRVIAGIPFPGPLFGDDAAWIAPIRTKPRRTYDEAKRDFSPEGTHVPYLLKRMLSGGKGSDKFVAFLRRFGKESGLFKQINIHKFGNSPTSPFEIEVILDSKPLNINNVGYGVAQGLPVIVEAFVRHPGTLFVIQQPEVHLHPRAQASIGEMIFNLASRDKKQFVVETHSDFTIDRFRVALRNSKKSGITSQVLFFERTGGKNKVTTISIEDNGDLSVDQPDSYRDFFLKEGLKVIGI